MTEVGDLPEDNDHPLSVTALESNVIFEDEQEIKLDTDKEQEEAMTCLHDSRDSPLITNFNLNGSKESQRETPAIIDDEEDQIPQDIQAKFLQLHH